MTTEKKQEGFKGLLNKMEKFSMPSIIVIAFTIGTIYAFNKQTLTSHDSRITNVENKASNLSDAIDEVKKVPIKYDEQFKNIMGKQDETSQDIRDLRLSIEKTNELIIKSMESKR